MVMYTTSKRIDSTTWLPCRSRIPASLSRRRRRSRRVCFRLAPVFKVLEDRVQLIVRVRLQVSVDRDVSPVANLFGQVRRVDDKLRLEKRVLSVLGQETQIQGQVKVTHGFVQETGVSRFVSRHERKDFRDVRSGVLQASAKFLVQKKAREFRRARSLQKFNENSSLIALDVIRGFLELIVADEMLLLKSSIRSKWKRSRLVEIRVDFLRGELFRPSKLSCIKVREYGEMVVPVSASCDPRSSFFCLCLSLSLKKKKNKTREEGKTHVPPPCFSPFYPIEKISSSGCGTQPIQHDAKTKKKRNGSKAMTTTKGTRRTGGVKSGVNKFSSAASLMPSLIFLIPVLSSTMDPVARVVIETSTTFF